MGMNIERRIEMGRHLLAEYRLRALDPIVLSVALIVAFRALGGNAASVAAQVSDNPDCLTCTASCLDGEGEGNECEINGPRNIGGNGCRVNTIPLPEPLEGLRCWCLYIEGLCWVPQAMSPGDRAKLEHEAVEVVAEGGMLPADGFFFLGSRPGELVVRWKCDGRVAGHVARSSVPAHTNRLLVG